MEARPITSPCPRFTLLPAPPPPRLELLHTSVAAARRRRKRYKAEQRRKKVERWKAEEKARLEGEDWEEVVDGTGAGQGVPEIKQR